MEKSRGFTPDIGERIVELHKSGNNLKMLDDGVTIPSEERALCRNIEETSNDVGQ